VSRAPKVRQRRGAVLRASRDESQIRRFLRLTSEPGGHGTVVAIDPESGRCTGYGYTSETLQQAEQFISTNAERKQNLYWTPNGVKGVVNKKPLKSDISAMRWVHLDLDDPSDEALERLRTYRLPPTITVFSGGGFNAYWKLDEPVHANGNIQRLEEANQRLILDLGGDKGTQNLDRILRLPHTTNWPSKTKLARGRVPMESHLVDVNSHAYRLEDFPPLTDEERQQWAKTTKSKTSTAKTPSQMSVARTADRSAELLAKVSKAVRNGSSDVDIHSTFDTHPHALDQSDAARAVQRCIDKARSEQTGIVATVNERNALIFANGKLLVMWPQEFEEGLPRLSSVGDMKYFWKTHQHGNINPIDVWLGSTSRREYSGFVFRPGNVDVGDKFNLFRGWGITADPNGSCALFLQHMLDVICNGDADLYDYLIQWLANSIQTPEDKPGTAIAMRSGQGAGKGFIARYLKPIYGPHLAPLGGSEQILGRFNDTLAGKIIVFGDEAAWPGDHKGMEKLKGLITEEKITVERKHVPAIEIDNHARYMFATNRDHSAPVEIDDRRFVTLDVSDAHIGDVPYWDKLEAERKGSGPAALLHYLLHVKLDRNLRITPKTAAHAEQKLLSLDDVGGFVRELLMRSKHSLDLGVADDGGTRVASLEFGEITTPFEIHRFYLDYCDRNHVRFTKSLDGLGVGLRRYFTVERREARKDERDRLGMTKRGHVYALPTLQEARLLFEKAFGQRVEWPKSTVSDTSTTLK